MNIECSCANCLSKRQTLSIPLSTNLKYTLDTVLFDLHSQSNGYLRPFYNEIHVNNSQLLSINKPFLANLIAYSTNLYCDIAQLEKTFAECTNFIIIDFSNIVWYLGRNADQVIKRYIKIKLAKGYKIIVVAKQARDFNIENILNELFCENPYYQQAVGSHLFVYRTSYNDSFTGEKLAICGGSDDHIVWTLAILVYNVLKHYKKIPIILTNEQQYMTYYKSFFKDLYPSDDAILNYNYNNFRRIDKQNIFVSVEEYTFNSYNGSDILNAYFGILNKYLTENYYDTICGNTMSDEMDIFLNNTLTWNNDTNSYISCMTYLTNYHFCGYSSCDNAVANLDYPSFNNLINAHTGEHVIIPNAIYFMILLKKLQWIMFGNIDGILDTNSLLFYLEHPEREI